MKICISILAESSGQALAAMKKAAPAADLIELRIDRFGGKDLERLLGAKTGPVLVTNRRQDEGGCYSGSEAQRIDDLKRAVSFGADIVDIELSAGKESIAAVVRQIRAAGGKTQLLVSSHEFKGTPSDRILRGRLEACAGAGADVIKIVTYANRIEDNLRVLSLIPLGREKGWSVVAFCMGEFGRVSRAAAPLFGAPFTFAAPKRGLEAAPGQMTAGALRRIFKLLKEG